MPVFELTSDFVFPPISYSEPDGLLAIGGDLRQERLLLAYAMGIFPWYNPGEPIQWWSPDPRFVLKASQLRVSKSMKKVLALSSFSITVDSAFEAVIQACGEVYRPGQRGTWITSEMKKAYVQLHQSGYAHSIEAWQGQKLVGGLYGVSLGKAFFGESMFSRVSNASKAAFLTMVLKLRELGFELIDCQIYSNHLASLGAANMDRAAFLAWLEQALAHPSIVGNWADLLDWNS